MITPEQFSDIFKKEPKENIVQFAKVDPNYTGGRPLVVYDVDIATGKLSKPLPYLSSYEPLSGDRVMVVKGVIIGKII